MNVIECTGLGKSYHRFQALGNLSFTISENKITGLIGRNGAGKTTLLKIAAGYLQKTSGEIKIMGQDPFNNLSVSAQLIFVDDQMSLPVTLNLGEILETAGRFYQNWDMDLARGLLHYFSLSPTLYHHHLSKGMRSTFNMIMGISARCPLTIFDEPTTGMDAAVRKDFYRALLKDYLEHPRSIILSSHHLSEIEDLLEDILLIKDGQKRLHRSVEDLKEYAIGLRGKAALLEDWTKNSEVLHRHSWGTEALYVIKNELSDETKEKAKIQGIELTSIPVEDLCVYLTTKTKGGIDDVFSQK